MKRFLSAASVLAAALFAYADSSFAVLGESADSIGSDKAALSAVRRTPAQHSLYTVHQLETVPATVREYASPDGTVFAVVWNGIAAPDLAQLFGSYYADYTSAAKKIPHRDGRRHQVVRTERVVVQRWGHMRDLRGRAYVPALLPQGVNIEEIK